LTGRGRALSIAVVVGLAVASSLAGPGCGTKKLETAAPWRKPRTATFEEVVSAYDGFARRLTTVSAKGDLEVRDLRAGKARRLGARVLAGRGGRLYVKATVAVVTALEVVADGQRFWFRVPSRKTVWTGGVDAAVDEAAEGEQAPYYALRPADVVEALLPEPLAARSAGEVVLFDGDAAYFSLTEARLEGERGLVQRRVLVGRESLLPAAVRAYDAEGHLRRESVYGDWREGLPYRVKVSRPREGYEAELFLDEVAANVTLPERAFAERPAEGYAVVEVGKP
jgi:hypothetical protein